MFKESALDNQLYDQNKNKLPVPKIGANGVKVSPLEYPSYTQFVERLKKNLTTITPVSKSASANAPKVEGPVQLTAEFTKYIGAAVPNFPIQPKFEDLPAWIHHLFTMHDTMEEESVRIHNLHFMLDCSHIPVVYLKFLKDARQFSLALLANMKDDLLSICERESVQLKDKDGFIKDLKSQADALLTQNSTIQHTLRTTEMYFIQLQRHCEIV